MPQIYESPDGGKTVYSRESGQVDRQLISGHPDDPYQRLYLWHDIVAAAESNPSLRELLDQVITMYRLIKEPT